MSALNVIASPDVVVVPDVVAPPITMFVAAPKALTVVAVVFSNAIVTLPAMIDVVNVGEVAKVNAPLPVDVVATADARFALVGVASHVATPVPRPDTPVLIGSPVQLVSVPLLGVPSAPPLTTNAPALPTATASAVPTFAPGVMPAHVVKSAS